MKFLNKIVIIAAASLISCHTFSQPGVGSTAKEISLPNTSEQHVSLSSLKGKVVLIDFWASWCRPCRQTVPGLKKLYSLYHEKGFEIYGVSLDDDKSAWKKAIQEDQSNWIQVNDSSGAIANEWTISVIPTSFLIDKEGKIIAVDENAKDLDKTLSKLLL